jgi:mitochondrial fission protein ELM1
VTPQQLAAARQDWLPRLGHLPSPRIAVLVGGPTRRRGFSPDMARALGQKASQLAADANGSLLVSTSRRTGDAADDLLAAISVPHHAYRYHDSGENPYLGYLALADAVIVTGDSASMCTEACATGVPVYIYAPPGFVTDKHRRLHQCLFDQGCARPLGPRLETWRYSALNSAQTVAEEILTRLKMSAA